MDNKTVLSILEKMKFGEVASALQQLKALNQNINTLITGLETINTTELPKKINVFYPADTTERFYGHHEYGKSVSEKAEVTFNQYSILSYLGPTTNDEHVVNVAFLNSQLLPIKKIAQLGISRAGDSINGNTTTSVNFNFNYAQIVYGTNTTVIFKSRSGSNKVLFQGGLLEGDAQSSFIYKGTMSDPDNLVSRRYVDQAFNIAIKNGYFVGEKTWTSGVTNIGSIGNNLNNKTYVPFSDTNIHLQMSGMENFAFDTNELTYTGPGEITLDISVAGSFMAGRHFKTGWNFDTVLALNTNVIGYKSAGMIWDNTNGASTVSTFMRRFVTLTTNDKIKIGWAANYSVEAPWDSMETIIEVAISIL